MRRPTDRERLDAAFAALNARGIVARQEFSCRNNCGFTEIWDEIAEVEKHVAVEGYVFYHRQAAELAERSGCLLLAYGSVEEDEAAFSRVVNTVVAELRRAGLNAAWPGTEQHPVVVEGIVWHREREMEGSWTWSTPGTSSRAAGWCAISRPWVWRRAR